MWRSNGSMPGIGGRGVLRRPGPRRPRTAGGGGTVITDEKYNYLAASMADDGLLHVGGRPFNVD